MRAGAAVDLSAAKPHICLEICSSLSAGLRIDRFIRLTTFDYP